MGDFRNTPLGVGPIGFVDTNGAEFGEIEYFGDADVFLVQLITGLTYTIELRGSSTGDGSLVDPLLYLVNLNNTIRTGNDDSGVGLNSLLTFTANFTGEHYLRAQEFGGNGTGSYVVSVSYGVGTGASETINGTIGNDAVRSVGGNDIVRGFGGDDTLEGGAGNDTLVGGEGSDFLEGGNDNDLLRGQAGDDVLRGGFQADILVGGLGADIFQLINVNGSQPGSRDTIRAGDGAIAFQGVGGAAGDRFDFSVIDADTTAVGDQAFILGGAGKGRIWLTNSGTDTIIRGNIDNDAAAEFEIEIEDGAAVIAAAYTQADFFL